ncbi:MAG: FAD:protein FMN transferase [Candidatus Eisenbacteria bacterium]|uniref:FAD:protein FMN transferase n=1 Tax=Eiseniibacteriota bacterium TaxID=2212470 RepID=A0A948W346_UNCEI|nr:FAD:protein FMN transferase [Candidatus Eisenbacteria bacterium]MBU1950226.1 FAD:protein FMN transferase [Candidatus Eisenbacteria bacterium]MBU2690682.1 FAD:protein FMN transferase [Candidatus Eisenbacteria bacterium]
MSKDLMNSHLLARIALIILALPTLLLSCTSERTDTSEAPPYQIFAEPMMGTTIEVMVPENEAAAAQAQAVFTLFNDIELRMSEWREGSPLAVVNQHAGGDPVPIPEDLLAVIQRGLALGDLTGGAFDITWAALWGLWDFKAEHPFVPDVEAIRARTALVDYKQLQVDDAAGTIRLPAEGMKIGLGGIAKGYALDRATALLKEKGVTSFLLSAGGQVYASGMRGDRKWRVGIRNPRGEIDDYFATMEVSDASVSTSGDYERFFILDGIRYHHILDPRTGRPARGLRSATVISSDATLADALSTAFMVMGVDPALALAETLPDVEAVLIDASNEVHTTSGMKNRLIVTHELPRLSP